MGGFVIFLSFIVFAWAVVGFFKPTAVKLPNRAASVGVWILSAALLAAGGALFCRSQVRPHRQRLHPPRLHRSLRRPIDSPHHLLRLRRSGAT